VNNRERFQATMRYQPRGRSPITDFNLEKIREVWGHNIDLKPMGELAE